MVVNETRVKAANCDPVVVVHLARAFSNVNSVVERSHTRLLEVGGTVVEVFPVFCIKYIERQHVVHMGVVSERLFREIGHAENLRFIGPDRAQNLV